MRTFWEDLSKRIGETAESVSNKAGEAMEIQKLKSQIRALERGTEEDLIDLGQMVYEYFEAGNAVGSEAEGLCEAIQSRKQSIADYEKRIIVVRGEFSCKNCGKIISNTMAYCPYCGEKMDVEPDETETNATEVNEAEVNETEVNDADVIDYVDVLKAKAEEAAEKAEDVVEDLAEKAADVVEDLAEKAEDKMEDIAEKTVEKAKEAADKLRGEEK